MEITGLRVNVGKTNLMVQLGRYPCGMRGRGVGVNSWGGLRTWRKSVKHGVN